MVFHLTHPDPSIPWAMAVGTTGMMISPAADGPHDGPGGVLQFDEGRRPVGQCAGGLVERQATDDEQRAREQIGLVRPGETTYVVMPPSDQEQTADKKERQKKVRVEPPPPPSFLESAVHFIFGF